MIVVSYSVAADGLYLRSDFFNFVTRHGKHAIAVLKDERRDLLKDARGLFDGSDRKTIHRKGTRCDCWDIDGFTSWPGLDAPVRVVRSVETSSVRRFHAFINRNLKAVRRIGRTAKYFRDLIAAEFRVLIVKARAFAPS